MEKNIEWLKDEILTDMRYLEGNREIQQLDIKYQTLREVVQKINSLDEPETLSQDWIVDNVSFIQAGRGYVLGSRLQNLLVPEQKITFEQAYEKLREESVLSEKSFDYYWNCINDNVEIDEPENLLVPEQEVIERHGMSESEWAEVIDRYKWHLEQEGYVVIEKPTIPQFVADYTEEYKGWNDDEEFYDEDNASDLFNAMDFDNAGMSDKVQDYLVDNLETFARAWLDGYTVEKEQKYYVEDSGGRTILAKMTYSHKGKTFDKVEPYNELVVGYKKELTEQEIKDYDERYWPFRKPVEELEK